MPEFYHISDLRYNGNSGVWVLADRHNASGSACHYADDEREKLSGKDEQERSQHCGSRAAYEKLAKLAAPESGEILLLHCKSVGYDDFVVHAVLLRQYRTKIVRVLRSQIFRQIVQ